MKKPMMIGMMKRMNGKMNKSLSFLFEKQLVNQKLLINKGLYEGFGSVSLDNIPVDDPKLMSYHIQQLVSEIGEILEADKRWKNFRNGKYNKESKLDEIADCFIVLFNVAMFSGFNAEDIYNAINCKIDKVNDRINKK